MDKKYSIINMPYAVLFNILKDKSVEYVIENFDYDEPKLAKLFVDPRYWLHTMGHFFVQNKPTFLSYKEWYDIYTKYSFKNPDYSDIEQTNNKTLLALYILYPDNNLLSNQDFWTDRLGEAFIQLKPNDYTMFEWLEIVISNNLLQDGVEDLYYGCENGIISLVEHAIHQREKEIHIDKIINGINLAKKCGHPTISNFLYHIIDF